MTLSPQAALAVLTLSSLVYLVLLFFSIWLTRSLELRLLLVGLLTALLAAWCGLLQGEPELANLARDEAAALRQAAANQASLRREAVAVLGRAAVLLIVGSVAVAVLGRWGSPGREEVTRDGPR